MTVAEDVVRMGNDSNRRVIRRDSYSNRRGNYSNRKGNKNGYCQ